MSDSDLPAHNDQSGADLIDVFHEPRLWRDEGWIARIIKNEDEAGWAVEMTRENEREPTLIGPWTMGRDKKNPKPIDKPSFNILVKTATEFRRRSEQQRYAQLHRSVTLNNADSNITVTLDIVPDDDFPYAELKAWNNMGELLSRTQVAPDFILSVANAERWVASDYRKPL